MVHHLHKLRRHELTVYALIWVAIFAAPVITRFIETTAAHTAFDWNLPLRAWIGTLPFFVLFWLHDLIAAPMLTRPGRHGAYAPCAALLILLFVVATCRHPSQPQAEGPVPPPAAPHAPRAGETPPPPRPMPGDGQPGDRQPGADGVRPGEQPSSLLGLVYLAVAVTMCGLNVAVKLYFKSQRDERLRERLSKESLEHELEALKFQINPHFFMNTLNNIHALIDIDPERAKLAVIELSVLMRYVLYEGSQPRVPLERELAFVSHYAALMRLRFTDKVAVEVDFPAQVPDVTIPPLIYATFVENAFKHGISYRSSSFVSVSVRVSGEGVRFECRNSIRPEPGGTSGAGHGSAAPRRRGIGLANARKRLDLIYGGRYRLTISREGSVFIVSLITPLDHD